MFHNIKVWMIITSGRISFRWQKNRKVVVVVWWLGAWYVSRKSVEWLILTLKFFILFIWFQVCIFVAYLIIWTITTLKSQIRLLLWKIELCKYLKLRSMNSLTCFYGSQIFPYFLEFHFLDLIGRNKQIYLTSTANDIFIFTHVVIYSILLTLTHFNLIMWF